MEMLKTRRISKVRASVPGMGTTVEKYRHYRETILPFIQHYWLENGYGPEIRDIQTALGISSVSVVSYWLIVLEENGDILWEPEKARTVRLPNMRVVFD